MTFSDAFLAGVFRVSCYMRLVNSKTIVDLITLIQIIYKYYIPVRMIDENIRDMIINLRLASVDYFGDLQ